jgi:hypothetical protein
MDRREPGGQDRPLADLSSGLPSRLRSRRRSRRTAILAGATVALLGAVGAAGAVARYGHRGHDGAGNDRPPSAMAPAGAGSTVPVTSAPVASAPATAATAGSASSPGSGGAASARSAVALPPTGVAADYQLSQPYRPASGVRVVTRDRTAAPAVGLYNICYVNAYQVQPDELGWWRATHPDLLLHRDGHEVVDTDWDEVLLDVSTAAKRSALLGIVGAWFDNCATAGFDAVEPDNLDSWTRSGGLLTRSQALDFAAGLTARAHAAGLAVAQKNAAELGAAGRRAGFDFAVAEECADYTRDDGLPECADYVDVYGSHVIVVEYGNRPFQQACTRYRGRLSVILRDTDLTAPGSPGYRFDTC